MLQHTACCKRVSSEAALHAAITAWLSHFTGAGPATYGMMFKESLATSYSTCDFHFRREDMEHKGEISIQSEPGEKTPLLEDD